MNITCLLQSLENNKWPQWNQHSVACLALECCGGTQLLSESLELHSASFVQYQLCIQHWRKQIIEIREQVENVSAHINSRSTRRGPTLGCALKDRAVISTGIGGRVSAVISLVLLTCALPILLPRIKPPWDQRPRLVSISGRSKWANYSPQAKFGPLPAFVNKVLSEPSKPMCSWILYGCFHSRIAELSSCNEDHVAHKA